MKKNVNYELLRTSVPLIFVLISQMFPDIIDQIVVSKNDIYSLPILGFASSIKVIVLSFSAGLLNYTTVLYAKRDRYAVLVAGFYLISILTIVSFLIYKLFIVFLNSIGIEALMTQRVESFLLTRLVTFPFFLMFILLKYYISYFFQNRIIYLMGIVYIIIKIVCNSIALKLVTDHQFVIIGVAISSNIADFILFCLSVSYVLLNENNFFLQAINSFNRTTINSAIKDFRRYGTPIAFASIFEVFFFSLATSFMGKVGADEMAGYQIALQITSFLFMFALGFSEALTIKISKSINKDLPEAIYSFRMGIIFAIALSTIFIFILCQFGENILNIYFGKKSPSNIFIYSFVLKYLFYISVIQMIDNMQIILSSFLKAQNDTLALMLLYAVSYYVIGLPCAYVLCFVFELGAKGIWYGIISAVSCIFLLLSLRVKLKMSDLLPISNNRPKFHKQFLEKIFNITA